MFLPDFLCYNTYLSEYDPGDSFILDLDYILDRGEYSRFGGLVGILTCFGDILFSTFLLLGVKF